MKKITTLIAVLSFGFCYGQTTAIPDPNFEQALIDLGYDNEMDNYILTSFSI